ncbi:MAG: hypothetical protein ACRD8O_08400 [Bryobacteraceae bacterium]
MRFGLLVVLGVATLPVFAGDWNPRLAAEYLDSRQKEWFAWKPATAPGGPCVSCHTSVTYLLARPVLRRALGEKERTSHETGLTAALKARVAKREPTELFPAFKKEPLASQAAGVESIHAALFLTLENAGRTLSPEAEQAFERMWAFQIREGDAKGAWAWFSLNLDPWEMPESRFYGASLAALAVGSAPAEYRKRSGVAERVADLVAYLSREQQAQPLHNRLVLLWASTKLREALPDSARKAIIDEAWRKQQADGGWAMETLGPWKEHPNAIPAAGSNSYATGLAAFALERSGVKRSDKKFKRALAWLKSQQDPKHGYWPAQSMNKKYEPGSMQDGFMRDAATAFSVMALSAH